MSNRIPSTESEAFNRRASVRLTDLLVIAAVALILALPMLLYGPMVRGHDTYEHMNYCRHFGEQFWGGEMYPRWLLNINHGLGSPSLFVYPPFGSYVYSVLLPLGNVLHFNPFNAGEFLALLASGLCAFVWVQTFVSRGVALAGAVMYMVMPYHLAADFYQRNALSECWALAWMPLLLYFASLVMTRKRAGILGIAVAYALLIVSHLVSVVIVSVIPLALALVLFRPQARMRAVLRIAAGMALGTGLSCFYLLSALLQAKHFPVLNTLRPPFYSLADNFIRLDDLRQRNANGFVHWVSVNAVIMAVFIVISGVALLRRGRPDSRRLVLFWLAACIVPMFLMLGISMPVWDFVLPLFKAVQYPWRLNVILCLAALFLGPVLISQLPRFRPLARGLTLCVIAGVVLTWLGSYGQIWTRYHRDVYVPNPRQLVNDDDGWFDSWTAPGTDQSSALRASVEPRVRFLGASGTSEIQQWKARHIEFKTESPAGGWVAVNQFYYPGWEASAAGVSRPLEVQVSLPTGLMEVQVPSGQQEIRVDLPASAGEILGRWISLATVLLCGIVWWRMKPEDLSLAEISDILVAHEDLVTIA